MKTPVRAFYGVVLAVALTGSTAAAAGWLGVPWWIAAVPVAAIELGGVVLMLHAAERQKLGETALSARLLSAAVAAGAVAINWFGHEHAGQAAFFAGMSALGYIVYLLISAAGRRDALRAARNLPPTAPVYGLAQWVRHPGLTRRARALALADPTLGLYGSLDAATAAVRAERREAAIAKALDGLIRRAAGPVMANIAVHTYDPAEIARRVAASADYDGYARLIGAQLTADRLAGVDTPPSGTGDDLTAVMDTIAPTVAEQIETAVSRHLAAVPQAAPTPPAYRPRLRHTGLLRPRRMAARTPAIHVTVEAPTRTTRPATDTANNGRPTTARKPAKNAATTEAKVAGVLAKKPAMTQAEVAKVLGIGERTVRRHWPRPATTVNGHDPAGARTA